MMKTTQIIMRFYVWEAEALTTNVRNLTQNISVPTTESHEIIAKLEKSF